MECHEFLLFSSARGDAPFGFVCGALHSSLRAIGLSAQLDHKTVLNQAWNAWNFDCERERDSICTLRLYGAAERALIDFFSDVTLKMGILANREQLTHGKFSLSCALACSLGLMASSCLINAPCNYFSIFTCCAAFILRLYRCSRSTKYCANWLPSFESRAPHMKFKLN